MSGVVLRLFAVLRVTVRGFRMTGFTQRSITGAAYSANL
jgi:hypothetical protein